MLIMMNDDDDNSNNTNDDDGIQIKGFAYCRDKTPDKIIHLPREPKGIR